MPDVIVKASEAAVKEAARILCAGGLVAFPTETVYGLGADATNGVAAARIFEAKARPRFNPLIVHVAAIEAAFDLVEFNLDAMALGRKFWPGPLTLVLPISAAGERCISKLVTSGLDTLAIRVPSHPIAHRLLLEAGRPIAAPSANLSGRVSATRASHVAADFSGRVDMILDAGDAEFGLESTIVSLVPEPSLLRPGAIARNDLEAVLGRSLATRREGNVIAPGQLKSHYAPRAELRLNAEDALPGEVLLAFGPSAPEGALNLSRIGDLREAAANLFAHLRKLDSTQPGRIAVMPIPNSGLGEAINDRLQRAAAPRKA